MNAGLGRSWKTTLAGILGIAVALLKVATDVNSGHPVDLTTTLSAMVVGVGLITAKDHNVSGPPAPEDKQ